jgi:FkbM family methyltransferase
VKDLNGVWLPDHEEHLKAYAVKGPHGEWTYQKAKMDVAVALCKKRGVAVDVGGHCGIWARELCKVFGAVHSFEPVRDHRECYVKNQRSDNWTLHPVALGEKEGRAATQTKPGSSGDTWLVSGDRVDVRTLDSFNLEPDFLKIDTEGYELFVLKGAEQTLRKFKPVVIVEQKPGNGERFGLDDIAAVDWLIRLGYKLKREYHGDYILQ